MYIICFAALPQKIIDSNPDCMSLRSKCTARIGVLNLPKIDISALIVPRHLFSEYFRIKSFWVKNILLQKRPLPVLSEGRKNIYTLRHPKNPKIEILALIVPRHLF